MAINPRLVNVGDTLWQKCRQKMSGVAASRDAVFSVKVLAVETANTGIMRFWASWNGNTPRWYDQRQIAKLYRNRPKVRAS
jgi:hypothetical protein